MCWYSCVIAKMVSKSIKKFNIPNVSGLSFSCHTELSECQKAWSQAAFQGQSVLHDPSYLNVVAHNFQNDMQQIYVVYYINTKVVGRSLFQCGLWEADTSYKEEEVEKKQSFSIKNWFAKKVKFIGILCGNILLTGEYGFNFDYQNIDKHQIPDIITKTAEGIQEKYYSESKYPSAIIAKDLYTTTELDNDWTTKGYHRFAVQPNMIMDIDLSWDSFDSYLDGLSSKYRIRAKRAYKKSSDIRTIEFSESDIEKNLTTIFNHFLSVQKNAGFNLIYLKPTYFLDLKRQLGDRYRLFGYYLNDELIGFNTIILNHDELEAHFLGFDKKYNTSHQLYMTMLFNKVKKAIELKKQRIIFARTALEIKSSVGAKPRELCIYLRHENSLLNKVVSPIISILNPQENWVPRHPFKK